MLLDHGFLGTAAPAYADIVLILEIMMGVALLAGAMLARKQKFRAHAWCQSSVVLANLAVVGFVMMSSFFERVSPKIPAKLGKSYYAIATAHGALGAIAAGAGLYILVSAGTSVLPEQFRIIRYKLWMRSVLGLWWIVLLLGILTYTRWYVPNVFRK